MAKSDSSPNRKRRPWRRVGLALALLLAVVLAGAVLLRETLATRLALSLLQDEGIPVESLEVTGLTPGAVSLARLSLGENGEVVAETLDLRLAWDGLAPWPEEVTLDGLTVTLDLTGDGPMLGSLQPLLERFTATPPHDESPAPSTTPEAPAALPRITLENGRVTMVTPSGPMVAALSGRLLPDDGGTFTAEAALDLDSELGRLRARLTAGPARQGGWELEAEIDEGRLAWQDFAVGGFDGALRLTYREGSGPNLRGQLSLAQLTYTPAGRPPLRLESGNLSLSSVIDGAFVTSNASLRLEGGEERLSFSGHARSHPAGESLEVDFTLRGEAATAGGLAQALPALAPGLQIEAGEVVAEAEGTGYLINGGRLPETWPAFLAALPQSRLALEGETIFSRVRLADGTAGLSGHLPLALEAFQDDLTVTLTQDAELRVERPSRQALQDLGVPEDLLPLVASGLSLTLAAGGDLPFKSVSTPLWPPREAALAFTATGRSDQGLRLATQIEGEARLDDNLMLGAFSGEAANRLDLAQVAFGGREAQGVALDLPLTTRYGPEGLSLALARPGSLKIRQFGREAPLRLEAPLAFAVKTLTLQAAPDGSRYGYALEAAEDGARLTISRAGAEPLDLAAGALDLKLEGRFAQDRGHDARLDLWLQGFDLPGYEVATEAAEVSVDLDSELRPESSRFTLGPVALTGEAPPLAPLTLAGQLQRRGAGYDITGVLGLSGGRALADLTARYDDAGRAAVEAVSRLITFSPDGLQPAEISPLLADLEEVSGNLTGRVNLVWPLDPKAESGRVTLDGFSFKTAAGEVRGLDLDLRLTSLLPLASAAGQKLTIAALDAAVPVEAVEVIFALDQTPRPQLAIARGGFDLGGARWLVEPLVVDPAEPRHQVVLGTEDLDLAAFFELIEVDGLSGQGALQGRLPIVFEGGDVIVEDGHFEAKAPGVLNIRIDALRAALSGSGETVEMAARALEDFRFENLSLDLKKTAANDATLRLSTLGHNPAVLNGQPFQFNINLESNLTSVLEALKQGYSLSDEALERAWRLRE